MRFQSSVVKLFGTVSMLVGNVSIIWNDNLIERSLCKNLLPEVSNPSGLVYYEICFFFSTSATYLFFRSVE